MQVVRYHARRAAPPPSDAGWRGRPAGGFARTCRRTSLPDGAPAEDQLGSPAPGTGEDMKPMAPPPDAFGGAPPPSAEAPAASAQPPPPAPVPPPSLEGGSGFGRARSATQPPPVGIRRSAPRSGSSGSSASGKGHRCPSGGGAAAPAPEADWQTVPVYWGTDRAVQPNAQRLAFGSDRARKLQLGEALITVPKVHQVPNVERPWVVKIPYFDVTLYAEKEDPKSHFTVKEIKALTKEELLAQVKARLGETFPIAELERRFYAFFIDRLFGWTLAALAGFGSWLVLDDMWTALAVGAGVMALSWLVLAVVVGISGNTPGKAMVGLRVVHHGTGTPIGVGRSLLRSVVLALASVPTFALGLATLAWTAVEDRGRQRRGWHDHLAHSVVVDVRPMDAYVDEVDEGPRHVVNLTAMRLIPAPPVEPPAPPRRVNPEQSMRRAPVPQPVQPPPVPQQAPPVQQAPVQQQPPGQHARQQPPAAPPAQPVGPPTPLAPPPSVRATRPPDDGGRTAVRVVPGAVPAGPRWRVTFDNGESFVVEGLALVGRRPEPRSGEQVHHLVPLSSADMSVSKTHAQFGPASDGVLVVMDRGSTNGSVLIRQGVSRPLTAGKPATLVEGDVVSFGDRQMSVSREA